jgi:hypothetical protein
MRPIDCICLDGRQYVPCLPTLSPITEVCEGREMKVASRAKKNLSSLWSWSKLPSRPPLAASGITASRISRDSSITHSTSNSSLYKSHRCVNGRSNMSQFPILMVESRPTKTYCSFSNTYPKCLSYSVAVLNSLRSRRSLQRRRRWKWSLTCSTGK